jgi:hypothetical protein
MVKEIIYRTIADFLSIERYHFEYMGLFELLQKERCRIKSMDKYLLPGNFKVNFPKLYRP